MRSVIIVCGLLVAFISMMQRSDRCASVSVGEAAGMRGACNLIGVVAVADQCAAKCMTNGPKEYVVPVDPEVIQPTHGIAATPQCDSLVPGCPRYNVPGCKKGG